VKCRLHAHFHGCGMYLGNVGTDFVTRSGMLHTAEDVVVIFPQARNMPPVSVLTIQFS
jgi:hypothetical protein